MRHKILSGLVLGMAIVCAGVAEAGPFLDLNLRAGWLRGGGRGGDGRDRGGGRGGDGWNRGGRDGWDRGGGYGGDGWNRGGGYGGGYSGGGYYPQAGYSSYVSSYGGGYYPQVGSVGFYPQTNYVIAGSYGGTVLMDQPFPIPVEFQVFGPGVLIEHIGVTYQIGTNGYMYTWLP